MLVEYRNLVKYVKYVQTNISHYPTQARVRSKLPYNIELVPALSSTQMKHSYQYGRLEVAAGSEARWPEEPLKNRKSLTSSENAGIKNTSEKHSIRNSDSGL